MKFIRLSVLATAAFSLAAQNRTILAIGAHAADMDLTAGALLAHHKLLGDRVVILHLTLGEGGNPKLSARAYGQQKRREAESCARLLGAEVIFGPYLDAQLPDSDEARRYVARVIRQVKPTWVLTHWKSSIHKDHAITHAIVNDAVLLASVASVDLGLPAHRGVKGVAYTDNWEDAAGFTGYLFADVSDSFELWSKAVREYEMVRGTISSFAYYDYYTSHLKSVGALAGRKYAVALDVDDSAKRRVLDALP